MINFPLLSPILSAIFSWLTIATVVACITASSFAWMSLWQRKEYRTDRIRYHFSLTSGKAEIFNRWHMLLSLSCIALLLSPLLGPSTDYTIHIAVLVVLLGRAISYGMKRERPVWTVKALAGIIVTITAALALALLFGQVIAPLAGFVLALLLVGPLSLLPVVLLHPVTMRQRQRTIAAAKQKLEQCNPIVIGITGSYGKSSTKRYAETLLSEKFTVLSTPKNINTDIGVAQTILNDLTPEHEVFLVEMGAYKVGEIAAICDLVRPIAGVVTAVTNQHLSLFGSLQHLAQAKGELLEALPSSGLAIVNADSDTAVQITQRTTAATKFYSTEAVAAIHATDIAAHPGYVQFQLHLGTASAEARAPLFGKQVVSSILAAAAIADYVGLSLEEIAAGVSRVESIPGTMHVTTGRNHQTIIDDNYNANPDGFIAALDYLAIFSDKQKIVVTPGMQELGSESDTHHATVGARIAEVADRLIITKPDFAAVLRDAAAANGMPLDAITVAKSADQAIAALADTTDSSAILLEGRVQKAVVNHLNV